jgi:hypothetical protein
VEVGMKASCELEKNCNRTDTDVIKLLNIISFFDRQPVLLNELGKLEVRFFKNIDAFVLLLIISQI